MPMKIMKAISSAPPSHAPQRRKRGNSNSTAVKVSAMPKPMAAARLSDCGTRACAMRTAAPGASVNFQRPEPRKISPSKIAPTQLNVVFQPGNSNSARP